MTDKITIDSALLQQALDALDIVSLELGIDWLRPEFAEAGSTATALRAALAAPQRQQNTAIDEACAKLEAANSELLRSLEEMKMWISIAVELACLDPKTTEVEFEFENGSPPKTISIYSSMQLANAAIEKNKSKS